MRLPYLLPLALVAGCSIGAPPGFSSGDSWSFPLVSPLEGGPLLVPVKIDDKGPYLFLIDPDSPVSQVDEAIASEGDLRAIANGELVDESDKARNIRTVEVLRLDVGTLTVKDRVLIVSKVGAFNSGGHQVRGVLGRDILADSLVFGFDRDAGMGWLATQKGFTPPADAQRLGYDLLKTRLNDSIHIVSRRMVKATIDGAPHQVHIDLGDASSQLRESLWGGIRVKLQRSLVDETGTRRDVDHGNVARTVTVGPVTASNVLFVPYDDKRWEEQDIDGTIGLNAFYGYRVWDNFSSSDLWFAPEKTVAPADRIARWGAKELTSCATPACVSTSFDAAASALTITRDPSVANLNYEVLLEARTPDGMTTGLPRMVVIFDAGESKVVQKVDSAYAGTQLVALDVSPFPRNCQGGAGACVYFVGESK